MDINNIIDIVISIGPTALFLVIVLFAGLVGFIRGFRKSTILAIQAFAAATLCLILFFILTKSAFADALLLNIVNSIMGGEGALQTALGVTVECETLKEVLIQALPNLLNFGDSIVVLLKENGAYLKTLVDFVYNFIFAIVLSLIYLLLVFILYIIYLIFYSERKFKKKKNKAFMMGKTDNTYKKRRLFGGLIGLARGTIVGIITLSMLGNALYLVAGTGDGELEEQSFGNDSLDMAYNAYRSVESYGTTGIYKVLNAIKDPNDQPYYLFAADLIFSGELEVEDLEINENIKFREEIGAYTDFAKDTVNLLLKHGGDDIKNIIGGKEEANMDVILEIMKDEGFKKDFEILITDFDSKTYFINLAFAMVTSVINNIDSFAAGLDESVAELIKIMFKKGHYSEYIPDEREASIQASRKMAKGKEEELETLPYLQVSHLITKEDVLTVYQMVIDMIDNEVPEGEEPNALNTVKEILPYISQLSILSDERKDEFDPVLTRLYCFVENKYLTNEGYDGITVEQIKAENISWVEELNALLKTSTDILQLYQNIWDPEKQILDIILSIFDDTLENHEENIILYDNVIGVISNSKILGKVMASNKMTQMLETSLKGVSENIYITDDLVFENQYDKDGNLVRQGELDKLLSGLRILAEDKEVINSLFKPEEGTTMFDTLKQLSTLMAEKDDKGNSLNDYFVDSELLRSVVSALMIDLGSDGEMFIYVPKASLQIDANNQIINVIEKEELREILEALPEIIELVEPIIEEGASFDSIDSILENKTVDRLLNGDNKIIEGTFSNVILKALSGVGMVVIPKELETVEAWMSKGDENGEFKNILSFLTESSVDLQALIDSEDKMSAITSLSNEDIEMLLASKVMHYTISNIMLENAVNMGSFKLVIPSGAKKSLINDNISECVRKDELRVLLTEFVNFDLKENTEFSDLLIKFVGRFLETDDDGNSILTRSQILSASLASFLVNDDNITSFVEMPTELKEEVEENIENYDSNYLWYKELPNFIFALEEMFEISSKDDGFVLGGEGEDGNLVSQLSELIKTFDSLSHIKEKANKNYTRLDVCYDSRIIKHNLTSKLEESLVNSGAIGDIAIDAAKDTDGYFKKQELYALSNSMDIFGVKDFLDVNGAEFTDNVTAQLTTLNKPRPEIKYNGRTTLDIMYDSIIITSVFSTELDKVLYDSSNPSNSIVDEEIIENILVKDVNNIYHKTELSAIIDAINALGIDSMDGISNYEFSIQQIRKDLDIIYKSYIMAGAFTKMIKDNTATAISDHPYAYEENIPVYRKSEITALFDIIGNKEIEEVDIENITLDDIKSKIYDDNQETQSYLLVATISKNLINNEESEGASIVIPHHTIDKELEYAGKGMFIIPSHINDLLLALDAFGINNLDTDSGAHFEASIPTGAKREALLNSDIMRASFTKMVRDTNDSDANLVVFKAEHVEHDVDCHGHEIDIIAVEELQDLFNALAYFNGANGELDIPRFDITIVMAMYSHLEEIFASDTLRYQVVDVINSYLEAYPILQTVITYETTEEYAYMVTSKAYTYEQTSTVEETRRIILELERFANLII